MDERHFPKSVITVFFTSLISILLSIFIFGCLFKRDCNANTALVVIFISFILGLTGIIFGITGIIIIRRDRDKYKGIGSSIIGIILGTISFLDALFFIYAIALGAAVRSMRF